MTINTPLGKITAAPQTLNNLALYLILAAEVARKKRLPTLEEEASQSAKTICAALQKAGLYDKKKARG